MNDLGFFVNRDFGQERGAVILEAISYLLGGANKKCGSQSSLGHQSNSRFEALFVPRVRKFGELFRYRFVNLNRIF